MADYAFVMQPPLRGALQTVTLRAFMSNPLIINVRRQLHWQRRLFSDASTAMLWGLWLWLFRPVFAAMVGLVSAGLGVQHSLLTALTLSGANSIGNTAMALVVTSVALLLWNLTTGKLAATTASQSVALLNTTPNYAAHFGLSVAQLQNCRSSKVCVVQHDEQGRIVRIDPAPAARI